MRTLAALATPLAFAAFIGPAAAQSLPDGVYAGGFLGWNRWSDARNDFDSGTGGADYEFEMSDGLGIGFVLGANLSRRFRGELEFSHGIGSADGPVRSGGTAAPVVGSASGDVTVTYLMANGWYSLGPRARVAPYIGGGIGVAIVDAGISAGGLDLADGSDAGMAVQAGFGARIPMSPSQEIDVGYRYRRVSGAELDVDSGAPTGSEFASHSLNLGYVFNF